MFTWHRAVYCIGLSAQDNLVVSDYLSAMMCGYS